MQEFYIYHCKLRKFVNIFTNLARHSTHRHYYQFWPPLHQNTFGDWALPGLNGDRSLKHSPRLDYLAGFGEVWGNKKGGMRPGEEQG